MRLTIFLFICLFLGACDGAAEMESPRESVTTSPSPGRSVTTSMSPGGSVPSGLTLALVTDVVDGDTIYVRIDGEQYTVRYIGVDTPEVDARLGVECFGAEASAFNRALVEGEMVGLEKNVSETDDFGRLLRYVWLGGEMVNSVLVREGYAEAKRYPPDVRHQELLDGLEDEARGAGVGQWGPACAATATATPGAGGPGTCEYSGTTEAVIKGNVSSGGERIFHVPGQENYEPTRINEGAGERWFCTEAEAVAAGWRKARR